MKNICTNKRATYDYFIDKKIECGIALNVSEVKSVAKRKCNISSSYVDVFDGELFIVGMDIPRDTNTRLYTHEEKRDRKLLVHKKEILEFVNWKKIKGNTIIPLEVYEKDGKFKVVVGFARGKKNYDKRNSIKEKDIKRENAKDFKNLLK